MKEKWNISGMTMEQLKQKISKEQVGEPFEIYSDSNASILAQTFNGHFLFQVYQNEQLFEHRIMLLSKEYFSSCRSCVNRAAS